MCHLYSVVFHLPHNCLFSFLRNLWSISTKQQCLNLEKRERWVKVWIFPQWTPSSVPLPWWVFLTLICSFGFVWQFPDATGYVGFANLPNQVHRKSVKKGFEFTLMVVGEKLLCFYFTFILFYIWVKIKENSFSFMSLFIYFFSGESGLGKSTLINSLFLTDLYPERYIPGAAGILPCTIHTHKWTCTNIHTVITEKCLLHYLQQCRTWRGMLGMS